MSSCVPIFGNSACTACKVRKVQYLLGRVGLEEEGAKSATAACESDQSTSECAERRAITH